MKNRNVFWGVLLIFGALLIVGKEMGLFFNNKNVISIIIALLCAVILIKGFFERTYVLVFVSLTLLLFNFGYIVGLKNISIFSAAVISALMSLGLSLIFPKKNNVGVKGFDKDVNNYNGYDFQEKNINGNVIDEMTGSNIFYDNKFGETTKYIRTSNLVNAKLENCFGELKVYFDNAVIVQDNVVIDVSCIFGDIQIFVPKHWNVQLNISPVFAEVREIYKCYAISEFPRVNIVGTVTFGEVRIMYI